MPAPAICTSPTQELARIDAAFPLGAGQGGLPML